MLNRYLRGETAFLSGAFRNMGLVIAKSLADCGANIVLNDLPGVLDSSEMDNLLDDIRNRGVKAMILEGDIASLDEVSEFRKAISSEIGSVSIVVNCAGPFNIEPYLKLDPKEWDSVMNVNLKSVYLTAQVFAPDMQKKQWGRIVNLSAGSSLIRNHGVYGLAKAGVSFLTEELALELGPDNITVNAIAPGQIEESLPEVYKIDPTFGERYLARTPLRKLVNREDIAGIVTFLCSSSANMLTGLTLRADGGAELPKF
ncbi:3-oxoacyl-[acyl-carrier-protein] reductase FabG [subsurface metagenome]